MRLQIAKKSKLTFLISTSKYQFLIYSYYNKSEFGLVWYMNVSNLIQIISSISQKSYKTFVSVKMTRSARSKKLNKNLSHRKSKLLSAMLKTCYNFDNEKLYVLFSNNFIYSRVSIITIIFKHEKNFKK